jgi:hypothetical protein
MLRTEEVQIEPTNTGYIARSPRYGIAETGRTRDEAAARLADGVRLMETADSRIASGLSHAVES